MIGILPVLVQRNSLFTWKCSHRHFLIEILRKDATNLIPKSYVHYPCSKCLKPIVVLIILKITIVKHKFFIMKTRMIEIMEHGLMSKLQLPFFSFLKSKLHFQISRSFQVKNKIMHFLHFLYLLKFQSCIIMWWNLHCFVSSLSLMVCSTNVFKQV
jgi:hypothetical protein